MYLPRENTQYVILLFVEWYITDSDNRKNLQTALWVSPKTWKPFWGFEYNINPPKENFHVNLGGFVL